MHKSDQYPDTYTGISDLRLVASWDSAKNPWTIAEARRSLLLLESFLPLFESELQRTIADVKTVKSNMNQLHTDNIMKAALDTGRILETTVRALGGLIPGLNGPIFARLPALVPCDTLKQCTACRMWNDDRASSCTQCRAALPRLQCARSTCRRWCHPELNNCPACDLRLPGRPMILPHETNYALLKKCDQYMCHTLNWVYRQYCRHCSFPLASRRCLHRGCGTWNYAFAIKCQQCLRHLIITPNSLVTFRPTTQCTYCGSWLHVSEECNTPPPVRPTRPPDGFLQTPMRTPLIAGTARRRQVTVDLTKSPEPAPVQQQQLQQQLRRPIAGYPSITLPLPGQELQMPVLQPNLAVATTTRMPQRHHLPRHPIDFREAFRALGQRARGQSSPARPSVAPWSLSPPRPTPTSGSPITPTGTYPLPATPIRIAQMGRHLGFFPNPGAEREPNVFYHPEAAFTPFATGHITNVVSLAAPQTDIPTT
jgi:hypothetical protein